MVSIESKFHKDVDNLTLCSILDHQSTLKLVVYRSHSHTNGTSYLLFYWFHGNVFLKIHSTDAIRAELKLLPLISSL